MQAFQRFIDFVLWTSLCHSFVIMYINTRCTCIITSTWCLYCYFYYTTDIYTACILFLSGSELYNMHVNLLCLWQAWSSDIHDKREIKNSSKHREHKRKSTKIHVFNQFLLMILLKMMSKHIKTVMVILKVEFRCVGKFKCSFGLFLG